MGAPKVTLAELDRTFRVPSFPGARGGIVVPALKGRTDAAVLVTSQSDFLRKFTPNETIGVGFDIAYYSALAYLESSDKLWVARAQNGALAGGVVITSEQSGGEASFAIPVGYADVESDYDFGAEATTWGATTSYLTAGKVVPTVPNGYYYHATTAGVTSGSEPVWPTVPGQTVTDGTVVWTCEGTTDSDAVLIYGANPGVWNNSISIKVQNYFTNPDVVKVSDAFLIEVYKSGSLVETWLCSRVVGKKDGFNNNIFVEDVLDGSLYIRGLSNPAITETIQPEEITVATLMTGGSDGSTVTDTHMIAAAQFLRNPSEVDLTIFMDGGWATAAFGSEINTICSERGDCVGILSTPFAAEASADYITDILAYRNTTLNLNSSYSALYSPHVLIQDQFNDRQIYVAPDGYIAGIISKTGSNFDLWLPPAGFEDRTKLPVLDVRRRFSDGELDTLYDAEINPIRFEPGEGIIPWGQKTLLTVPSSLDRLNVRLMLIVVEPAIKKAMKSFLFKQHIATTRSLAEAVITNALNSVKNSPNPGVTDFRVQVDDDNNLPSDIANNRMNVWVFLVPTRVIEEIPITVILTNPGAELAIAA